MARMAITLIWLAGFYGAFCALAFFFQTALIFPGTFTDAGAYKKFAQQEIALEHDGVRLQGWHFHNTDIEQDTLVIYFGGNGEDVVYMLPRLQKLGVANVFAFNYRGYGLSEGSPSQTALYVDALAIYDQVAAPHIDEQTRVVVIGRSLGSAVAGQLVNQRPSHGLILLTPLRSATHSGQTALPFLPVRWLIRHPLDLYSEADKIAVPVLMIVADGDTVISPRDSLETYAAITSPKQLVQLPEVGHNNLFSDADAFTAMQRFVRELERGQEPEGESL